MNQLQAHTKVTQKLIAKSGQFWLLPDDNGFLCAHHEDSSIPVCENWEAFQIPELEQDFWDDVDTWPSLEAFLNWMKRIARWDYELEVWVEKS